MKPRPPKKSPQRRRSLSTTLVLGGIGLLVLSVALVLTVLEPDNGRLCASTTQRSTVRSQLEASPGLTVDTIAESLHASTAVTLDAYPADRRAGVRGDAAAAVWESLRQWPDPVVDLVKDAQDFEIRGPLPPMREDQKKGRLTVGSAADTLQMRLIESELGAIYAFTGSKASGEAASVVFLDRKGTVIFRITPAHADSPERPSAHFVSTLRYMGTLPGACRPER